MDIKVSKNFVVLGCLLPITALAAYNDPTTDFTNEPVEEWVEDITNNFVNNVNAFGCIINKSRADIPQHVNSNWKALVDEGECFNEKDPNNPDKKSYMDLMLSSSRASSTTPQEVRGWVETAVSDRYIINATISSSADDLPPFGSWYFSYYENRQGLTGQVVSAANAGNYGFVDIGQDNQDVSVKIGSKFLNQWGSGEQQAQILFVGGDPNVMKFIGRDQWTSTNYSHDDLVVGQANANHYYRITLDPNNNYAAVSNSDQCLDRNSMWSNAWGTKLFYLQDNAGQNISAGDEVKFNAGFSFEYNNSSNNGFVGDWGVWMETDNWFSPSNNAETIVSSRDNTTYSLQWSPGKLFVDNVKVAPSSAYVSTPSTAFVCANAFGCIASSGPVSWADWKGNGSSHFITASQGDYYFYTGASPAAGYEPLTLYYDADGSADLSSSDKPVRFNFSAYFDASGEPNAIEFGTSTAVAIDLDWSDGTGDYWPNDSVENLVLASDWSSCQSNSSCTEHQWRIGAFNWDTSYYTFNTDGSAVEFDKPLQFEHVYAAAEDLNAGETANIQVDTSSLS